MEIRKNEEAVSPVIGVILMVAITVILAAVIAAFVFGMGPPKQAPQASLRITSADVTANTVTVEHQGGSDITLANAKLILEFKDSAGVLTSMSLAQVDTGTNKFTAGDKMIIQADGLNVNLINAATPVAPGTVSGIVALAAGGEVTVTMIDIPSGQMIVQGKVRS